MLSVAVVGFSWNPILSPFCGVAKGALKAVGLPVVQPALNQFAPSKLDISTDGLRTLTPAHVALLNPSRQLSSVKYGGPRAERDMSTWTAVMTAAGPDAEAHGPVSACRGGRVAESGWKRDRGQKQQSNRYIPRKSFA